MSSFITPYAEKCGLRTILEEAAMIQGIEPRRAGAQRKTHVDSDLSDFVPCRENYDTLLQASVRRTMLFLYEIKIQRESNNPIQQPQ